MTTQERKGVPIPQVAARASIPEQNLRIPGPTPIPPEVMAAQAAPMINFKGPEFSAIMERVTARLQYFFQTEAPVLICPASGTGGLESAVVNVFSPGDHVVALTIGVFGNRLATIANRYGLQVTRIEFPWGQAADPAVVATRLKELAPYRGVFMTHNETSTGVTNDVQELAQVVRRLSPEALIVVDAVSSLSCVPLEMDLWDLDVVFSSSQKGWMTPPGLMMIAASPRAWAAHKTAKLPRFYFDWELPLRQFPITPAVSLLYALDVALEMMLAEGREAIFERHQRIGEYVRWRVKAMGLRLLADHQYASNTVTAVLTPPGIDTRKLLNTLRQQDHVVFGGGQQHLDGKIFRVGHLGFFTEADLKQAMDAAERRLLECGFQG